MKAGEAHVRQDVLLVCDMLQHEGKAITVDTVLLRLAREMGYDYPRDFVTVLVSERDQYVYDVKTHGYVRGER